MLTVYTDTQDLGIHPIEPVKSDLVRGDLGCSDWRPGQGEEGQDDVLLSQVIAQAGLFPQMILQGKSRCGLSNP